MLSAAQPVGAAGAKRPERLADGTLHRHHADLE
jgi:hypothetical protein